MLPSHRGRFSLAVDFCVNLTYNLSDLLSQTCAPRAFSGPRLLSMFNTILFPIRCSSKISMYHVFNTAIFHDGQSHDFVAQAAMKA